MCACSLEPGDAPEVRDLLLAHYRDPTLEVEGKLGRRSRDRFTAGVSADQFAALEAKLLEDGAACLGLLPDALGGGPPEAQVTIDRFHALAPEEDDKRQEAGRPGRARGSERLPTVRSSYACDAAGRPHSEPFEVLNKTRLSDCHIGRQVSNAALPEHCLVDLRVSFSQETELPEAAVGARLGPLIHERRKRRRTFEALLWRVMLTHVTVHQREAFEVEVELKMEVVRARLESAAEAADEALAITRELVAALREMARWAAEIPMCKKRKRVEDLEAVERELKTAMEEPEVDAELRRHISLEGREALHLAKRYLCDVIRLRLASVSESALHRSAGRQVAKVLQRQQRAKLLEAVDGGGAAAAAPAGEGRTSCGEPPAAQLTLGIAAQ